MDDPSNASRAERGLTLAEILDIAGVNKTSVIRVTGPAGLAAVLWFARHGYEQVGYVRPEGWLAADGDLLFLPRTCEAEALDDLLSRPSSVRPGGLLIVQTPEPTPGGSDPARALLEGRGYRVERCLHGRRRELHVARRRERLGVAA